MKYFNLKIRSEPTYSVFQDGCSFLVLHNKSWLKSLTFSFFGWDYDIFLRMWCHYMGIPCQNWETPQNHDFQPISSHNVHADNQMIPVLLKTSFKYRSQPLTPPPLAHPSCPQPLAPFLQPLPQQFGSPLPKVNRQLKIVNYFTCMRHFFCRW